VSAPMDHPFSSARVAHRAKEVENRILTDADGHARSLSGHAASSASFRGRGKTGHARISRVPRYTAVLAALPVAIAGLCRIGREDAATFG